MTWPKGFGYKKYSGMFRKGQRHQIGEIEYEDGRKTAGEFYENSIKCDQNQVVLTDNNGFITTVSYKDCEASGPGIVKDSYGKTLFKGTFKDGEYWEGKGFKKFSNGYTYEGEFSNGKLHGQGTLSFGKDKFIGTWNYGQGKGQIIGTNGDVRKNQSFRFDNY